LNSLIFVSFSLGDQRRQPFSIAAHSSESVFIAAWIALTLRSTSLSPALLVLSALTVRACLGKNFARVALACQPLTIGASVSFALSISIGFCIIRSILPMALRSSCSQS
jgi:hypothetical protein